MTLIETGLATGIKAQTTALISQYHLYQKHRHPRPVPLVITQEVVSIGYQLLSYKKMTVFCANVVKEYLCRQSQIIPLSKVGPTCNLVFD